MNAELQSAPRALLPTDRHGLAMQGFFSIMEHWQANNATARRILGNPPERTFFAWKGGRVARLGDDTLRRIGYVAGIWKALQIVYSQPTLADAWVGRPNDFFGGQTPLERMAAGDVTDLAAVRSYIDAARAPWS
jgi:antitoxin Xre/MbcA/ParS-like protein